MLLPIYAAGFVTAFGAHAVAANLAGYTTSRHGSLWQLGLLLGVYDLAEVVLKPMFGSIVDRRGAKPIMLGGLVAFALASAAFALAGQVRWLGVARLAQGCAAAAFSPAAGAALAAVGGKKRSGRLFGGYGGAKGIGYLLGPIAGGALVVAGGYRLLFAVVGAVALAATLAVVAGVPSIAPAARQRSTLPGLISQARRPQFLRPVLLLAAATGALSTGVGYLPLLGVRHHLSPLATGALVSLLAATAAVVQPWAGRRHDRDALPADATTIALTAAAAGFGIAIWQPSPAGLAAAAVLIGAGVAIVTPLGFAQLAAGSPPDRLGRTMGAGEVGRELGDGGGPILVGAFGPVGLSAGLAALAGVLLLSAGITSPRRGRRGRNTTEAVPSADRAS
jgi:MFS family permease